MKDVSLTFRRNAFTNDVVQLDKRKAIQQKIYTILNLSPGDIVYKDYLFSGLKRLLGESVSNVNSSIMKEIIHLAMINYVPEIELIDVKITPDYDKQSYHIKLYYAETHNAEQTEMSLTIKTAN